MGGKLDFSIGPAEQRNVFSSLSFSVKINKKRFQNYHPKNTRDFRKVQKTIMTGGMSTVADNTYVTLGQQCVSRW